MKNITSKLFILIALLTVSFSAVDAQSKTGFGAQRQLETKIRKEINTLPFYDVFDLIQYQVGNDGTVTLSGLVNEGSTRSGAVNRVKRLDGVKRVVNNIELSSLSRSDEVIRRQAYYKLANTGRLGAYLQGANPSMRILVNNGRITLGGYVNNRSEVNMAYVIANTVPGTFGVTNNLVAERDVRAM